MVHMMQYKIVISESTIVAACRNTSIRISEKFKSDKKVRWLRDTVSLITRCRVIALDLR